MTSEKKLYLSLFALTAMGGAVYLQQREAQTVAAGYSLEALNSELPALHVEGADIDKIDKISVLGVGRTEPIELIKKGKEEWRAQSAKNGGKASISAVTTLLTSLGGAKLTERISASQEHYKDYHLSDAEALKVVFYEGKEEKLSLYFGDLGSRGQLVRIGGQDGVFALRGIAKPSIHEELNDWRDRTIFRFDSEQVAKLELENSHGRFEFTKTEEGWQALHGSSSLSPLENFDVEKFRAMLRTLQGLSASDFRDQGSKEELGLEKPLGQIKITLADNQTKYELAVGSESLDGGNWVQNLGTGSFYSISQWNAGQILGDVDLFANDPNAEEPPATESSLGGFDPAQLQEMMGE